MPLGRRGKAKLKPALASCGDSEKQFDIKFPFLVVPDLQHQSLKQTAAQRVARGLVPVPALKWGWRADRRISCGLHKSGKWPAKLTVFGFVKQFGDVKCGISHSRSKADSKSRSEKPLKSSKGNQQHWYTNCWNESVWSKPSISSFWKNITSRRLSKIYQKTLNLLH